MESLLDFSQPVDIALLEEVNQMMGNPSDSNAIGRAQDILIQFRDHPEAYKQVDAVLQKSSCPLTLFFALQVLEKAILERWNTFPDEEQLGIRNFLIGVLVQWCQDVASMKANRLTITKLNSTIIAIAKREWPARWPNFVDEVCGSCDYGAGMLENNIALLGLLGEEVFVFGEKTMTSRWIERKKEALADDLGRVFDLCRHGFGCDDQGIQIAALNTFEKYVAWVPLTEVFEPQMFDFLVNWALPNNDLRGAALACLNEVVALKIPSNIAQRDTYDNFLREMFETAVQSVVDALPTVSNAVEDRLCACFEQGTADDERVIDNFCQLVCTFLKNHVLLIRHKPELVEVAHRIVLGCTVIDNKEMFKSCVDYWWHLGDTLVRNATNFNKPGATPAQRKSGSGSSRSSGKFNSQFVPLAAIVNKDGRPNEQYNQVLDALGQVLSDARFALIRKMAKPEEIVIVEDENGELQHVAMTDVETLELYNTMRETMIFLTTLDHKDMRQIFMQLVRRQVDRSEWSWQNLNTLSWAVGSIGGTMQFEDEKALFADVVKALLDMCAEINGADNKAVIASCIMYVTGQYPRFLECHERFLRTVVFKLFEFMSEPFPGVKDMAVDTFLKITKVVPNSFSKFFNEIVSDYQRIGRHLGNQQLYVLYQGFGKLISTMESPDALGVVLSEANEVIKGYAADAANDFTAILNDDAMRAIIHALRLNLAVAKTGGTVYIEQMKYIFLDLQGFYGGLGGVIADEINNNGEGICQHQHVKLMRIVKKETLRLLEHFVEGTDQFDFVSNECMPIVFEYVLSDYQRSVPAAKDANALALITACVKKLDERIAHNTAAIIDTVFDCTVEMISHNMEDFPDHRVNLFRLLQALSDHCFGSFLEYCSTKSDVIEGVLWAIKHSETNMMMTGLHILDSFVGRVGGSEFAEAFFTTYIQSITTDVLSAMLDTMHQPGFHLHCSILAAIFAVVRDQAQDSPIGTNAVGFMLSENLSTLETLTPTQIESFIADTFACSHDIHAFKTHMADFLIEVQVWGAEEENKAINAAETEMRAEIIPGFMKTNERATYLGMNGNRDQDGFVL